MTQQPRGRRPSGSGTREAILAAAKRRFGEVGYPRTTLRSIATDAGVDVRLITHYFGSKQELFALCVELPFDPETAFEAILAPGMEGVGERLARFVIGVLETDAGRQTITGLLRAAASEEEAAETIRQVLVERMLGPLAERLGTDHPDFRGSLMGSQIAGLSLARYVVQIPALVDAPVELLVQAIAPVFEHYLNDPLPGIGEV